MSLQKFSPGQILISDQDAWKILVYFFGGNAGLSVNMLTDNDKSFAQALLIEAVDKSADMSWIQTLWESSANVDADVKGILKALAKKAIKDWLHHAEPTDLEKAEIYVSVKNKLVVNWRSAWQIRIETGDPVY